MVIFYLRIKEYLIELTEIRWDTDKNGINKSEQESLANQIIQIAEKKYIKRGLPPLYVKVSFINKYGLNYGGTTRLTSADKEKLSDSIIEKVIEFTPTSTNEMFEVPIWNEQGDPLADEKIDSLSIIRYKSLDNNCWTSGDGGRIPDITYEKLNERIQSKNKAVINYKKDYDESWLVIVEYWNDIAGYFSFRFIDEFLEKSFKTSYNRVFILRSRKRKVIEFKTADSNSTAHECDVTGDVMKNK